MPTPKIFDIVREKERRYTTVPDAFITSVEKNQVNVYKSLEELLFNMEVSEGTFVLSDKNLAIINQVDTIANNQLFNDEYKDSLTEYLRQYKVQTDLTNKYYTELNVGFGEIDPVNTVITSQRNALELLGQDAFTQNFTTPLKDLLNQSVTGQATLQETIQTVRLLTLGNDDLDSRILSHAKRVAYDAFAVSDRTYTNAVANQLQLEFYLYFGGEIDDTREFCAERLGKYFHKKEIEGWGDGKRCCGLEYPKGGTWQGRNSATNKTTIFTLAGGYNCKHSILPVGINRVPKEVIERNINNGNYIAK